MQVILREDLDNLGKRGDVVDVAAGYARNYLLRRKLAMAATAGNLKTFEVQKEAFALREQKDKADAEIVAAELEKWEAVVSRKAGESGALFGSVISRDISELLATKGIVIDRRKIQLREPIKSLGSFKIPLRLHREVIVEFPMYVVGETQREHEGIRERQVVPPAEEVRVGEPVMVSADEQVGEKKEEKKLRKGKGEKKAKAGKGAPEEKEERKEKREKTAPRKKKGTKAEGANEE